MKYSRVTVLPSMNSNANSATIPASHGMPEEGPAAIDGDDQPGTGAEKEERAGNDEPVVEHGDLADKLGKHWTLRPRTCRDRRSAYQTPISPAPIRVKPSRCDVPEDKIRHGLL